MTIRLDGGLATRLQDAGLPQFSPVEPWLTERPYTVQAAHQAFVDAGAQGILCATFLAAATPETVNDVVTRAVAAATPCGAQLWGCSGPVARDAADYADLARALVRNGVEHLVLETFTTLSDASDALVAVKRATPHLIVVTSLVPSDGVVLGCKTPLLDAYRVLHSLGADGIGANCASPEQVLAAQASSGEGRFWAKPSHTADWARRTRPLRDRSHWLGGCCGVSPADLAALWAAP